MANILKTNFAVDSKYEAFYTGGKIDICQDGIYMFCGCGNQVKVLEIETGKIFTTIGQDEEISRFCLSPDNKYVVLATQMLLLRQWEWKEKVLIRSWKAIHTAPVSFMTFDDSSTLLATGSADSTIKIWDIVHQYCTHNLRGHQGVISIIKFHPDMSKPRLFSGGEDYHVRVWDLQTSVCLAKVDAHFSIVTSMEFTADGKTLFSAGRDGIVGIWDVSTYTVTKTIPVFENVESLILLKEGTGNSVLNVTEDAIHFITAGNKGVLRVWNASSATCVYSQVKREVTESNTTKLEMDLTQAVYSSALNAIIVTTFEHNIYVCRPEDFSLTKQFAAYNDEVLDIQFLGKNDSHIAVATNSNQIRVFQLSSWNCQLLHGHTDIVLSLHTQSHGQILVSSSKDNSIRVWKIQEETGSVSCVATGFGHTHAVGCVAMSRLSTKHILSGGQDCTLKLWDVPDQMGIDQSVASLHCQLTEKAHDKDINSVVIAPNDKFAATGSQDRTAKLWSMEDLSLKGVLRGHKRGIWCIQFSPVDQCLVTSSGDGTIKIWALSDCSCVKTFEGHDCSVMKVIFLSKGMQLMSAGSDGLLKLWTIKLNECIKTLDEHQDKVWALTASRHEDQVITGGADSAVVIWKDITNTEINEIKEKEEEFVLQEQELSNLMLQKKYLKAIGLAITLDQPFKVLGIIKDILTSETGQTELDNTLSQLRIDQIDAVLKFAVKWNMNSKHCHEAQFVLSTLLKTFPAEELLKFPNIGPSIEGLLPYTDRHFQRMSRLLQQSKFLEYTWQCMRSATTESDMGTSLVSDLRYPVISEAASEKKRPKLPEQNNELLQHNDQKHFDTSLNTQESSETMTATTDKTEKQQRKKISKLKKRKIKEKLSENLSVAIKSKKKLKNSKKLKNAETNIITVEKKMKSKKVKNTKSTTRVRKNNKSDTFQRRR